MIPHLNSCKDLVSLFSPLFSFLFFPSRAILLSIFGAMVKTEKYLNEIVPILNDMNACEDSEFLEIDFPARLKSHSTFESKLSTFTEQQVINFKFYYFMKVNSNNSYFTLRFAK